MSWCVCLALFKNIGRDRVDCRENKATKFFTNSEYTHCEIYFYRNHTAFLITPEIGQVVFRNNRNYDREGYEFLRLEVTEEQYVRMYNYCTSNLGKKYDTVGFYCWPVLRFMSPCTMKRKPDYDSFTCAKLVLGALKAGEIPLAMSYSDVGISPAQLHDIFVMCGAQSVTHNSMFSKDYGENYVTHRVSVSDILSKVQLRYKWFYDTFYFIFFSVCTCHNLAFISYVNEINCLVATYNVKYVIFSGPVCSGRDTSM